VTGLSAEANYLYLGSRNQNRAYRYTLPTIASRVSYCYFTLYSQTRDIVKTPDNLVWVASDNTTLTLACYNTSGVRVDDIMNDLVPHARGVAMDPDGYLWVSDPVNDLIYKIDLSLSLQHQTWGELKTMFD